MIHMNAEWARLSFDALLNVAFGPQYYAAWTIDDFVDNRRDISPTGLWGASCAFIRNKIASEKLYGGAYIFLKNVNFSYDKDDYRIAELEDMKSVLSVQIYNPISFQRQVLDDNIRQGDWVKSALLSYHLKHDETLLLQLSKHDHMLFHLKPDLSLIPAYSHNT